MIQTLVIGGTGFVGASIVRQLRAQNETVHVLTRNPLRVPKGRRVPGVYYVKGDVMDVESLKRACKGCDAIIHCVQFPGAPFENPKKGWTYMRVDGQGSQNVAQAAIASGVKRVIYISGAGSGQGRKEPWFVAKDIAEQAIRNTGSQWTILRPSWIYGPQDVSLNKMAQASNLPIFFPIIGKGNQRIDPLFVEDMAKSVGYALNREIFFEKTLDLGGPETLTFLEMMKVLLMVQGKKRVFLSMPARIIKLFADFINMLPVKPFITSDGVDFLLMDTEIDTLPARALFNFKFQDLETALRKYL